MKKETSLALKVPRSFGEHIRRKLLDDSLLKTRLKIKKDDEFLYLPIKNQSDDYDQYAVLTLIFEVRDKEHQSYKDRINIPNGLVDLLPTSFDIVGSIVLIKIPDELEMYQSDIGHALLDTYSNVESVCNVQPVTGEFRTRDVSVIAGINSLLTVHTEFGLQFHVDVGNTYFSSRLGGERMRVAKQVKPGEVVVDMFAGVAPFPVMIARYAQPDHIYAIDKNEVAVGLARKNCILNKVEDKIDVIHADAKDVEQILAAKKVRADRVIMNLPLLSFDYLPNAFRIMAKNTCIHYYEIIDEQCIEDRIDKLREIAREHGVLFQKFVGTRKRRLDLAVLCSYRWTCCL